MAFRKQGCTPAFRVDTTPNVPAVFAQQVTPNLILDGDISCEKPLNNGISLV